MRRIAILPVLILAAGAAACGTDAGAASRWVAEIDTVGDTIVVRTISGGVWGSEAALVADLQIGELEGADEYLLGSVRGLAVDREGAIFIYDSQVPALRKYDRDGRFVMNFGREGGGPGEYRNSDGGIAILEDGRIILRDQGNARFQLWTPDGTPDSEWRYLSGFSTSTPMYTDTAGYAYTPMINFGAPPPWRTMLARYDATGFADDTIQAPSTNYQAPQIRAEFSRAGNTSRSINTVPFSPTEQWTFSPLGYFVSGVSTRYAIVLHRPEGPLRIERVVEPVAVDPAEKTNAEEMATSNMRSTQPDWKWNGPGIPDTKPPFSTLAISEEGRVWVTIPQPGERIPDDELDEPRPGPDGSPRPVRRWREPLVFDVFEPDGRYIGRVRAPTGFGMNPSPIIRADTVWGIHRDDLGVQRLTRYHIQVNTSPSN